MATPTQTQARRALLIVTLPLSALACTGPAMRGVGIPALPSAPGSFVREEHNAGCENPPHKRFVVATLPFQTPLADAVAWMSSVACKPVLLPGAIAIENKMLTIDAPPWMTPDEAHRLFLGALERVGLTIEPDGQALRIADLGPISPPPADADPLVTVLLHFRDVSPEDRPRLFEPFDGTPCDCIVSAPDPDTVIITDRRSKIEHLLHHPIAH
jgi:hypothetical protein